jgi:hypothetical protein
MLCAYYLGSINAQPGFNTIKLIGISLGVGFLTFFVYFTGKVISLEWSRFDKRSIQLVLFEKVIIPMSVIYCIVMIVIISYVERGAEIVFDFFSFVLYFIFYLLLADFGLKAKESIFEQRQNLMEKEKKLFSRYPPQEIGDMWTVFIIYFLVLSIPAIYSMRHI